MRNISKHHFSGGIVLQNSIMDTHFSTAEREIERERERERERDRERERERRERDRGRGRPKSDGCRCEERGHQNFPLCRDRKLMTPKWNY